MESIFHNIWVLFRTPIPLFCVIHFERLEMPRDSRDNKNTPSCHESLHFRALQCETWLRCKLHAQSCLYIYCKSRYIILSVDLFKVYVYTHALYIAVISTPALHDITTNVSAIYIHSMNSSAAERSIFLLVNTNYA